MRGVEGGGEREGGRVSNEVIDFQTECDVRGYRLVCEIGVNRQGRQGGPKVWRAHSDRLSNAAHVLQSLSVGVDVCISL